MAARYDLGEYSSFSFRPADYTLSVIDTVLTYTAKTTTFITVNHPPAPASPAKSDGFCLRPDDKFTISIPSETQGDVTLIGHHVLNIQAEPCRD
jgi:hypothetical protein